MNLPANTPCIEISEPGGPGVLQMTERELAPPQAGEVVIRVAFAGINRPDVFQREGGYPPPPGASDIPGLEVAGEIAAVGEGVTRWRVGDSVCALLAGGGYSHYAIAHQDTCMPLPSGLTLEEAASLPETCLTVWYNLMDKGGLQAGDVVLIHGGSSGIGTTAIQMARAFGARVFTTAGTAEKCRACEGLGAEKAFNYREEDFRDIKKLTERGADIILDMVGGDYIQKNIKAAAPGARIINIAFLKGAKTEVDFTPVMLKQLILTGSTLRSQPVAAKARIARQVEEQLWPLFADGQLKPVIHKTMPLAQAAEAHRLMESSTHIGKILLRCSQAGE